MDPDVVGSDNPPEDLLARFGKIEAPEGDLLHGLVSTQTDFLNSLVRKNPERWGDTVEHLKEQVLMIIAEAVELLNCLHWKKHKVDFNSPMELRETAAAIEEVVDLQHFVFNCFILLGVREGSEIYRLYMAKHGINRERQEGGY